MTLLIARRLLICCALFSLFMSCGGVKVGTERDSEPDFSRYTGSWTYKWGEPAEEDREYLLQFEDLENIVKKSVNAELESRGFLRRSSNPGFLVFYDVLVEDQASVRESRAGYGTVRFPEIKEYQTGSLLIEFVDPETDKLLWWGEATEIVAEDLSPEQREKRVMRVVKELFADFKSK
jgi:hypothetical protein